LSNELQNSDEPLASTKVAESKTNKLGMIVADEDDAMEDEAAPQLKL
jgi:hypothetical protein